jgi:hypothetical protein
MGEDLGDEHDAGQRGLEIMGRLGGERLQLRVAAPQAVLEGLVAERRPDPGQELDVLERLADEVVGAVAQAGR